jgi:hypothetical protein
MDDASDIPQQSIEAFGTDNLPPGWALSVLARGGLMAGGRVEPGGGEECAVTFKLDPGGPAGGRKNGDMPSALPGQLVEELLLAHLPCL